MYRTSRLVGRSGFAFAVGAGVGFLMSVTSLAGAAAVSGEQISVLPVVSCDTTFGISGQAAPWHPQSLAATMSGTAAKRLNFYSNGFFTVLAPRGWACAGLVAADGGSSLSVYPVGAKPANGATASATSPSVTITGEYTGHGPGALLVCVYFPSSPAARFFGSGGPACPKLPAGTRVQLLTADIAEAREPSGAETIVLYPQVGSDASVNVTVARCALTPRDKSLCAPIIADVIARHFPSATAA